MCGDVDEEAKLEDELYARFLLTARSLIARQQRAEARGAAVAEGPYAYMDKLFSDALQRAARDAEAADPKQRYDRIAMQPLVFARLAGLLAAHLSLEEDPLRKVIEALMHGYAEAETIEPDHGHDHEHGHGHDHHH